MLALRRLISIGIGLTFALVAAVSCGGSTKDGKGGGGSSGQDGGAGASGSGGAAGMPARCSLPSETGNCDAYFPAYFHNPVTGVCEPFVYGGCGGNDNRFETREACQAACRGGTPDMDACVKKQPIARLRAPRVAEVVFRKRHMTWSASISKTGMHTPGSGAAAA